jgi:hypothetical protein
MLYNKLLQNSTIGTTNITLDIYLKTSRTNSINSKEYLLTTKNIRLNILEKKEVYYSNQNIIHQNKIYSLLNSTNSTKIVKIPNKISSIWDILNSNPYILFKNEDNNIQNCKILDDYYIQTVTTNCLISLNEKIINFEDILNKFFTSNDNQKSIYKVNRPNIIKDINYTQQLKELSNDNTISILSDNKCNKYNSFIYDLKTSYIINKIRYYSQDEKNDYLCNDRQYALLNKNNQYEIYNNQVNTKKRLLLESTYQQILNKSNENDNKISLNRVNGYKNAQIQPSIINIKDIYKHTNYIYTNIPMMILTSSIYTKSIYGVCNIDNNSFIEYGYFDLTILLKHINNNQTNIKNINIPCKTIKSDGTVHIQDASNIYIDISNFKTNILNTIETNNNQNGIIPTNSITNNNVTINIDQFDIEFHNKNNTYDTNIIDFKSINIDINNTNLNITSINQIDNSGKFILDNNISLSGYLLINNELIHPQFISILDDNNTDIKINNIFNINNQITNIKTIQVLYKNIIFKLSIINNELQVLNTNDEILNHKQNIDISLNEKQKILKKAQKLKRSSYEIVFNKNTSEKNPEYSMMILRNIDDHGTNYTIFINGDEIKTENIKQNSDDTITINYNQTNIKLQNYNIFND